MLFLEGVRRQESGDRSFFRSQETGDRRQEEEGVKKETVSEGVSFRRSQFQKETGGREIRN
ncbi:MAG: hypothetical protein F6K18_06215 [Okeania sp. SIO2C2]|uniref:hypothetical protein n=1 Tax=Okeania sp. SIO2C2 TaxID=2607787 RepID=UPI0013BC47AE|nr:hypothetical protein [Okeania sp. SIO2C2]NEP86451.1 hypothetical protein [Okeania sp. SIO2C2]